MAVNFYLKSELLLPPPPVYLRLACLDFHDAISAYFLSALLFPPSIDVAFPTCFGPGVLDRRESFLLFMTLDLRHGPRPAGRPNLRTKTGRPQDAYLALGAIKRPAQPPGYLGVVSARSHPSGQITLRSPCALRASPIPPCSLPATWPPARLQYFPCSVGSFGVITTSSGKLIPTAPVKPEAEKSPVFQLGDT